jgi:hypothetical protein
VKAILHTTEAIAAISALIVAIVALFIVGEFTIAAARRWDQTRISVRIAPTTTAAGPRPGDGPIATGAIAARPASAETRKVCVLTRHAGLTSWRSATAASDTPRERSNSDRTTKHLR